jgi:ubiquinone biosynthesis protein
VPNGRDALLDLRRSLALVRQMLRSGLFPGAERLPWGAARRLGLPVRLRLALEELGLTYLKLGQFLATRFDMLPPEVIRELNKLFEDVAPMPFAQARAVVESELGRPLAEVFPVFHERPIAAASVAQVHEAWTAAGRRVAVKVQRLDLEPILRADIRILRRLGAAADALHLLGNLTARGMVEEFARWTLREMDFTIEGRTADRLRRSALDFEVVPRVLWEATTSRVLTMDYEDGYSASQLSDLREAGQLARARERFPDLDLHEALRRFARASFHQFFVNGFFHGDPHPGNVLFGAGSTVIFIDFGIFGSLSEAERDAVVGMVENLAVGNLAASYRYYLKQLLPTDETDPEIVRRECLRILQRWYRTSQDASLPIEERHLGKHTADMINVSRKNGLRFGLNYLLFWRAMNLLNATLWRVDPRFDLTGELREFFAEIRPGPARRLREIATDPAWQAAVSGFVRELPAGLDGALRNLAGPEAVWEAQLWDAPPTEKASDLGSRWISAALVAVSLAVFAAAARAVAPPLRLAAAGLTAALGAAIAWRHR